MKRMNEKTEIGLFEYFRHYHHTDLSFPAVLDDYNCFETAR